MKRRLAAVLVAGLFVAGLQAAHASPSTTATIAKVGQSAFWPGSKAVTSQTFDFDPMSIPNIPPQYLSYDLVAFARGEKRYRWEYTLKVPARGHRLRVAFDAPSAFEWHYIDITPPGSNQSIFRLGYNSGEVVALNPRPGVWRVGIFSGYPTTDFRLRARLEPKPATLRGPKKALLPNLRLIPPFEFTFANPYRGVARGQGSDMIPAPSGTANCWWDEVVEHQAIKCLRFSLGPINAGAGPLDLVFADDGSVATPGPVTQRIHFTDGSTIERLAGTSEFHKTHMHYHHTGFGTLELFKVTDPARGVFQPAGTGPKQGFCTADIAAYEWNRFAAVQDEAPSECLSGMGPGGTYSPTGTQMGISPGWADIYDWSQSGNYVEFGMNTDGRYIVRSTADASGFVKESNERDNTSYAYIELTGTQVSVLERGFGLHPWDRSKRLANDILRPTPRGFA